MTFTMYDGSVQVQAITPDRLEISIRDMLEPRIRTVVGFHGAELADLELFFAQLGRWRDAIADGDDPRPFVDFHPVNSAAKGTDS